MAKKIRAMFIFEIMGMPPEHIKKTLEEFVDKLGENKGIEIIRKKVHEPKIIEEGKSKGFYTTFEEVELYVDNLNLLFNIIFNMLPSHVEVFEPDELKLDNFELASLLSDLTVKMHKYDEISKMLMLENNNLINKIKEMQTQSIGSSGSTSPNINFTSDVNYVKKKNVKKKKK
jgi:hypothetical protein